MSEKEIHWASMGIDSHTHYACNFWAKVDPKQVTIDDKQVTCKKCLRVLEGA